MSRSTPADYIEMAAALRSVREYVTHSKVTCPGDDKFVQACDESAQAVAIVFARHNRRFDQDLFLANAGVKEPCRGLAPTGGAKTKCT